ncbi:16S rRNA (cytidine(1402)-2'-O)-methyltransferase [Sedimenticola selenatireducens]|uniref:Ribosomal RNA small subunit methyltransferase I n=1 Tax=Sedimenticola selenatireducens TaxID=191960 RepID=A0A2N6CZ39_9GAMM|nr:16S rRNA (cytidine(1402)-2'-O)-methyltransferase [Sedimenticola selenatireducens]PLX62629.1 MAG: 16S rRNA (cytidine(1402)-2'-O)-methyltransferase [Sedimenticola selenatireducens]
MDKGCLYIVAMPIGNRGDITERAKQVLSAVDLIAVEDTRHSRPLLQMLAITTPLLALHEHNEQKLVARLVDQLTAGDTIALISDAGTPLISDPGFPLVRACQQASVRVIPVPGPSALICALSAAGLPTDRFLFEGFPARSGPARREQFRRLKDEGMTLIFYESSHRILDSLADMAAVFGEDRPAVIARELTKLHETILSQSLGSLVELVSRDLNQQKGEFVVLVAGAVRDAEAIDPETQRILEILLEEMPTKQAATLAAKITGIKKNRLYQKALELQEG